MEQGTGKTRTALELIKPRIEQGKVDKVLWLCPCSVKENLKRDIIKHCGDLPKFIRIEGIESLSASTRLNFELLSLVNTCKVFLIVDESNLVKNHKAKRTQRIQSLAEKSPYRLILNGTPISKNEKDLFSQWQILDWRILGYQSFWSFAANHLEYDDYGKIRSTLNTDYLVRKIAPYTYQVKKSECLDLPPKTYSSCHVPLTGKQWRLYQEAKENFLMLVDECDSSTIYRLFTALQHVVGGFYITSIPEAPLEFSPMFKPEENPRIEALSNVVNGISEKVIIWCKYTQEIKDVACMLREEYGEDSVVEFYGGIKQKQRQENINKFSNNARFFVANKTCAGYGLNLQFCSYAIYYSNDWDYATRMQSEDRIHRIGQENNVHIIDLCSYGTIDERILKCLYKKEALVDRFKDNIDKQKDKNYLAKWIDGKGG